MNEFFDMGGYAAYVWPCFGLTAVVLAWNLLAARRSHAAALQQARRRAAASAGS
jgi:heme exporter protein D